MQYCFLELAIAISALTYFVIFPIFNNLYIASFHTLMDSPSLLLVLKLVLSVSLLSIPAFFMGGTLPVMSEMVVHSQRDFGKSVAGIYFINTLGACAGAVAGGFWLPELIGFTATYYFAISISFSLALLVFGIARYLPVVSLQQSTGIESRKKSQDKKLPSFKAVVPADILLIAAWSGMASLALQILWTRLFSQVLQNSTYTFSAILTVFLLALTLGALIARKLAERVNSRKALAGMLLLSGLFVAMTPAVYMHLTNDMRYIGGSAEFVEYMLTVIATVALTIGPAVVIMGICLPYLYKLMEQEVGEHYGAVVGRINSVNTYAGIVGSLLAGFVLFYWLGTWQAIYSIALLYMLSGILMFSAETTDKRSYVAIVTVALIIILLNPGKLPVVPVDPIGKKERLLHVWEGSSGTVAVVDRDGNLKTKLNNWYALGGSAAKRSEALQTHLPINLHGSPESIFYLGLGTGITAGTSLNYPVKNVVVTELVKEVITASELYFAEHTNDLFADNRVRVVNEDGRQYLQGTQESFDLIIADLFIPWRAGVSNVYALEHYQQSIKRLNDNGFYVQWIPLYQVTNAEFAVIAKTMKQVFPIVTAWRGDFYAEKPIIALIGHQSIGRLSDQELFLQSSMQVLKNAKEKGQVPLLSHYVGQIHLDLPFIINAPINTDDKPVIEYMAPVSHRAEKSGKSKWFIGSELLSVMHEMRNPNDIYLQGLTEAELRGLFAGYFLHAAQIARSYKDEEARQNAMREFRNLIE
jgi:spermidine synthase